jgi:hypothetical protein
MSSAWRFVLAIGLASLLVGRFPTWGTLGACSRGAWGRGDGPGRFSLGTASTCWPRALALFPLQMEVG